MVPVNWTNNTLENSKLAYEDIDKLSISNIPNGSNRFWTHLVMAYAFTFWTCYVLKSEYELIALMRFHFLASEQRRPDQFTVLVRNIPPDPDESVNQLVEHFFLVNHPDHFLTHQVVYNANILSDLVSEKKNLRNWLDFYQRKYYRNQSKRPLMKTGFLGLWGNTVDAIDYYESEVDKLSSKVMIPSPYFSLSDMSNGDSHLAAVHTCILCACVAYVVFRHQIINVYNQEYESAAAFWPDVHGRIITAMIVSQLLLMGLLSTKEAVQSTPLLIALPVLTIWFHLFCKGRYEPAFLKYPLQEAMMKDTLERTREPNLNLKGYLQNAYIHPVFKGGDDSDSDNEELQELDDGPKLVPTKRTSRRNAPVPSLRSASSSCLLPEPLNN
uniref:CSC1-like protein n=1 Tax=Kalanchoe fedtschenkoi TaxID=63787 RepID=A0A7N0TB60_KALFE